MIKNGKPYIIKFKENTDGRGTLTPIETGRDIPFNIKRVFCIYNLDEHSVRADHANMNLAEVIICIAGSCTVELTSQDGSVSTFRLSRKDEGLFIPKMIWNRIFNFEKGSMILVIADEYYDPDEIIWDKDKFLIK